ncbi:MAG: slipin family protein [Parcubacteria group bacterium]|nr:slipin family protein [Parcubacteria group bacterium]
MYGAYILIIAIVFILLISIRQINQYERGVKLRLGRYVGMREPGWRIVLPIIESMSKVDMRIKAVDVPEQKSITKDNVSILVNAVIYYRVSDAARAILEVENFFYAVSQLAQTTMRNVVGEVTLDELLSERDKISLRIQEIVDRETDPWGIKVSNVDLKDIVLSPEMERTIAKQAEAERERRAVIINSEGEVLASENMAKAAQMLTSTPGALHLRTLQTINDVSSDASNTIVFAMPIEVLKALEGFHKK